MRQEHFIFKKAALLSMLQKKNTPSITVDMDGQARTSKLDTGADEFSTDAVKAKILNPADVGAGR